ncbi:MAG: HAMP domain-containing sensor histidine kinase [Rhodocyclaceae bacterium]|nr:HAMP domain-containing sensor histidine kinase [Rhodocyclaceae bacterium]MDZ4215031.1 HAMP domain-containing sensor histidine kinase [Rhodocyclaceae bacterium]
MKHLGIRDRILLAAFAPAVLVALLVTGEMVISQRQSALESQHRRIAAMARQVATIAEFNLFAGNIGGLQRQLELAVNEPDILAAAFLTPEGTVITSTVPVSSIPDADQIYAGFETPATPYGMQSHWHAQPIHSTQTGEFDLFSMPEQDAPLLGQLIVQISTDSVQAQVRRDALRAIGIAMGILILGILLALGLARGLIITLGEISTVVESIGRNRPRRRALHTGPDELGLLAQGINSMADAVAQTQDDLVHRINEATTSLRAERDAAAQAAESRSRFFAAASHDLRQPAHALGLFVTRLERDARHSPLLPHIEQLAHTVKSLQQMLDELLDYSRLSGGVFRTSRRPIRASDVITALAEEFDSIAHAKHLALRQRVTDCWLLTDPSLLNRILINLVSNALRYTQQGGVLIACRRGATHARIEVWDTGIGIAEDQQTEVFEELVQLGNPERDPSKGLGLGLAIVRRTADLLGHPLSLRSRVGHGSCFSLTIPLAIAPAALAKTFDVEQNWILLLATDAATNDQIDDWGLSPTLAPSIDTALALIAHLGTPTLIITDSQGDLTQCLAALDRLDTAAGQPLPALLIHPGPVPDTTPGSLRRLLPRPYRPARLRALIDHLLNEMNEGGETASLPASPAA